MNLGDLQSTRSKERQKDSLQHLREDFYIDVGAFIAELRTERERAAEAADDPFDAPEVRRLTDDIETAEDTVEAIYERRVGKLVKLASLAAAGMPADRDGLTEEERELFGTLVEAIESNRGHVLDGVLAGSSTDQTADGPADDSEMADTAEPSPADENAHGAADAPSTAATEPPTAPESVEPEGAGGTSGRESPPKAEGGVSAADVMGDEPVDSASGSADEPPQAPSEAADASDADDDGGSRRETERTTVRITRDVGEILGADERTYELASEDVVTLPDVNATPLLERDAAERLD
jgi:DNA replication factor GINS